MRGRLKRGRARRGCHLGRRPRAGPSLQPDGSGRDRGDRAASQRAGAPGSAPAGRLYRQIMLANIDQIVLVFACADPEPHLRMLDRFLVIAEKQGIPAADCGQQGRPGGPGEGRGDLWDLCPPGLPGDCTPRSSSRLGVQELRDSLAGKISGLAGPSGVGKSSLLNVHPARAGAGGARGERPDQQGPPHHRGAPDCSRWNAAVMWPTCRGCKSLALWDTAAGGTGRLFPRAARAGHGHASSTTAPTATNRAAPCARRWKTGQRRSAALRILPAHALRRGR